MMKSNPITTPSNQQQTTTPSTPTARVAAEPPASRTQMSESELGGIVLPLTAFLAASSSANLLMPQPHGRWGWHEPVDSELQVRFRLDPRFFREETPLDEPLMALLRANRRGFSVRRPMLRMSLELFYEPMYYGYSYRLEAALVISANLNVQREACLKHVNDLLHTISRPGYIRPLTGSECVELGRSPLRHSN